MLRQRITYVVAGLIFGVAWLCASIPALAHGFHDGGHPTAAFHGVERPTSFARILVRSSGLAMQARDKGMMRRVMSHPSTLEITPAFSSIEPALAGIPCNHAGGCGCCGANGGCCGMSCCATALPSAVPTLPHTFGPPFTTAALRPFQSAYRDTLLRPPRPLV